VGANAGGAYLDRNGRRRPPPLHRLEYLSKAPATQFRICLRKRRTLTRTLRQVHEMGAHPVGLLLNGLGIVTPGRRGNEPVPQPSPALENPRRLAAKKNSQNAYQWTHFFQVIRLHCDTQSRRKPAGAGVAPKRATAAQSKISVISIGLYNRPGSTPSVDWLMQNPGMKLAQATAMQVDVQTFFNTRPEQTLLSG
jgi:hypothetical protein